MKQTFPTPDMTHLVSIEFSKVYEPSGKFLFIYLSLKYFFLEDTFLLLDALEENYEEFKISKPSLILEVGYNQINYSFLMLIII